MREITTTVYKFDELNDRSKAKAIEAYRTDSNQYGDVELSFTVDTIKDAGEMIGIEFSTRAVPLMNGSSRRDPNIYYSLSYSQGDGASFEGSYSYAKGAAKKISKEFGDSKFAKTVARIAQDLQDLQRSAAYQLTASVSQSGYYSHSHTMTVDVSRADDKQVSEAIQSDVTDLLREFADAGYRLLLEEYEYQNSDEVIAETLEANDYEFTEDGQIA